MTAASYFPGFKYPSTALLKFLAVSDFFSIMLKSGEIIHFSTDDEILFRQCMLDNHIEDIRKEGWIVN